MSVHVMPWVLTDACSIHACSITQHHMSPFTSARALIHTARSGVASGRGLALRCTTRQIAPSPHLHTHSVTPTRTSIDHMQLLCHTVPTHARASVTTYYCAHITTTTSNNAMTAMHACQCLLLNVKWRALHVITCRMTDGATIATSCAPTVVDASNTTHMHI